MRVMYACTYVCMYAPVVNMVRAKPKEYTDAPSR